MYLPEFIKKNFLSVRKQTNINCIVEKKKRLMTVKNG